MRIESVARCVCVGQSIWLIDTAALRGISNTRGRCRDVRVNVHCIRSYSGYAGCVEGWIDDPKSVVLIEKCLFVGGSSLDLVNPFHIGEIGTQSRVGERAVLTHGLSLKTWGPEVRERIAAGIVVVIVAAHERSQGIYGIRI